MNWNHRLEKDLYLLCGLNGDEKEIIAQTKSKMLEGAKLLDELDLGWTKEEEGCAIIDREVSG